MIVGDEALSCVHGCVEERHLIHGVPLRYPFRMYGKLIFGNIVGSTLSPFSSF